MYFQKYSIIDEASKSLKLLDTVNINIQTSCPIISCLYFFFLSFQGGFAKCYEIKDSITHDIFAGKIVPKSLMTKSNQREKMTQEITIHKSLNHRHIVGFQGFFDDNYNVYIILELCRKRVRIFSSNWEFTIKK